MLNSVKSFSVGYNPINSQNVFFSGDCITGQVTLELSKECKIESLCVKLKGKAEVKWTENHGQSSTTYHAKNKYFSIKQFIVAKGVGNIVAEHGSNVYPFTFQIPAQDLPSSFNGNHGKIVYSLEANLGRSMWPDSKAKAIFTLLRDVKLNSDLSLTTSQQSTTEKKMRLFTSGTVSLDVNIERTGYHQGEGIKITAFIYNKSSREIRPKYCLYKKHSYFASKRRKLETKDILKEVGEAIPPSVSQTVTRVITISPTTCVSILNCEILKVEYRLRVYLDVKYASDPEIKFPIVILPALQQPSEEQLAYGFNAVANSDLPGGNSYLQYPTATVPSAPPPPYAAYGMYPSLSDFSGK